MRGEGQRGTEGNEEERGQKHNKNIFLDDTNISFKNHARENLLAS